MTRKNKKKNNSGTKKQQVKQNEPLRSVPEEDEEELPEDPVQPVSEPEFSDVRNRDYLNDQQPSTSGSNNGCYNQLINVHLGHDNSTFLVNGNTRIPPNCPHGMSNVVRFTREEISPARYKEIIDNWNKKKNQK